MANTATNVSTGKPKVTGGVWVAPRSATLPTDAVSALSADYKCLGYVSDAGVSNDNSFDVSEIKAWGGNIIYRSVNKMEDTFKFALIETANLDVLKTVYGNNNVSVDGVSGETKVNVVSEDPQELIYVIELALRGGIARRIVIADGAITARDTITYNDTDAIAYGVTVSAYPDANNVTHKEYTEASAGTAYKIVTFDTDEGSEVPSQIVVSGGTAVRPVNPTKDGYTFAGWYADDAFTTDFDWYAPITTDTTVYAKWTA